MTVAKGVMIFIHEKKPIHTALFYDAHFNCHVRRICNGATRYENTVLISLFLGQEEWPSHSTISVELPCSGRIDKLAVGSTAGEQLVHDVVKLTDVDGWIGYAKPEDFGHTETAVTVPAF
tara:strand:- start:1144 stop:1503 length:360 start_codon:yes stop_codon:yes gene_type:complete